MAITETSNVKLHRNMHMVVIIPQSDFLLALHGHNLKFLSIAWVSDVRLFNNFFFKLKPYFNCDQNLLLNSITP